jgi:hypothetical protein
MRQLRCLQSSKRMIRADLDRARAPGSIHEKRNLLVFSAIVHGDLFEPRRFRVLKAPHVDFLSAQRTRCRQKTARRHGASPPAALDLDSAQFTAKSRRMERRREIGDNEANRREAHA